MQAVLKEIPTQAEILETLAREVFDLDADISRLEVLLKTKKAELISRIGEGETYLVPGMGKIVITSTTQTRSAGTFNPELSVEKFMAASLELRNRLQKEGIVSFVEKMVRGTAASVRLYRS